MSPQTRFRFLLAQLLVFGGLGVLLPQHFCGLLPSLGGAALCQNLYNLLHSATGADQAQGIGLPIKKQIYATFSLRKASLERKNKKRMLQLTTEEISSCLAEFVFRAWRHSFGAPTFAKVALQPCTLVRFARCGSAAIIEEGPVVRKNSMRRFWPS